MKLKSWSKNGAMRKKDRVIIETFARRVREEFPEARVWAFGSRARGDATRESDFDVCVVLEKVERPDARRVRHLAWEVAFENETVLNTIILSAEEFEKGPMSESTLVANILRDGFPA